MLGLSWLKSEINKSCDTPYATPFMADTAPSWVPKSVRRTNGARACASVHKNIRPMNAAARSAAAPGPAGPDAKVRGAVIIAVAAAMAAQAFRSDAPGVL